MKKKLNKNKQKKFIYRLKIIKSFNFRKKQFERIKK